MTRPPRWMFAVDVGGTFCDVVAVGPDGRRHARKLLSSGALKGTLREGRDTALAGFPADFFAGWALRSAEDGGLVEIERSGPDGLLAAAGVTNGPYELSSGEPAPVVAVRLVTQTPLGRPLPVVDLRLGTTRGTNALLERTGAKVGLLITEGFADALAIGHQDRPELFALDIEKPRPLTHAVEELPERVAADGSVLKPLDGFVIDAALGRLRDAGCEAVAVALVNAYREPRHERLAAERARVAGFRFVTMSTGVSSAAKFLPRAETAVLDAYLAPVLREYLDAIGERLPGSNVRLMTSAGGLVPAAAFGGAESVLSGPAGGVVGASGVLASLEDESLAGALAFDMGGTSTDVCRVDARGGVERQAESVKAGVRLATPTLSIHTVAAGGGSVCRTDGRRLLVGPQSAGADPGPACYGRGGPLTVTDCNVLLGRVSEAHFPFALDHGALDRRLEEVLATLPGGPTSRQELAAGFVRIADLHMAQAVRRVSVSRGRDPADDVLVVFGGAGGQHACAVAEELGCRTVVVPPLAGLLSAVGIGRAEQTRTCERPVLRPLTELEEELLPAVSEEASAALRGDGDRVDEVRVTLSLRYAGTEAALDVVADPLPAAAARFEEAHRRVYGSARDLSVEVVSVRATAVRRADALETVETGIEPQTVRGPGLLADDFTTLFVAPGWTARRTSDGMTRLTRDRTETASYEESNRDDGTADPVLLEVYYSRFMAIATQAGEVLRATSISPNIKERLDYSVALFDGAGRLVANAPHVPVHLGAMGRTVRHFIDRAARAVDVSGDPAATSTSEAATAAMMPGDVWLTNDPARGGSHLPDVTCVTPVFADGQPDPAFFVASRAHHAEIGGVVPGSVPPHSRTLAEEGVRIVDFLLMRDAAARWEELRVVLSGGPYPSRAVPDNLADIAAQVACNRRAVDELLSLAGRDGWPQVSRYMDHVRAAAAAATRRALAAWAGGGVLEGVADDRMDDGSRLAARVRITPGGTARIDFTGTAGVCETNLNANPGIVTAAVLYVLRLLIGRVDTEAAALPLNEGVLQPVELVIPPGLLSPFADVAEGTATAVEDLPAVVGGNTETSQRVVDVLLAALGLAAASQGTMNNVTFGDATFGYYETIGGGSGGTPTARGADAVQVHMTNTRITDVEVLERRLPVRLRRFSVRRGSGGRGVHRGGDGLIREIEFLRPLRLSLLTGRRLTGPPGLGGEDGQPGVNRLVRADGSTESLPWRCGLDVAAGDRLVIETPGGGGWSPDNAATSRD